MRIHYARRVAISIFIVGSRAAFGEVGAFWGLRKLPDVGKGDAAEVWRKILTGDGASWGGRARVVDHPIFYFSFAGIFADILGGHDGDAGGLFGGDAGTIDSREKVSGIYSVDPGVKVGSLFRKQPASLLLIKEDDGLGWKSFRTRGSDGGGGIRVAYFGGVAGGFDFRIGAAVEHNQEAETCGLEGGPFSRPGIGPGFGWIIQPVSGVGKSLAEGLQIRVAGIIVAIEADVSQRRWLRCGGIWRRLRSG